MTRAIQALPRTEVDVLQATYFNGLSMREIAEQQELPPGTVKTRVRSDAERAKASVLTFAGPAGKSTTPRARAGCGASPLGNVQRSRNRSVFRFPAGLLAALAVAFTGREGAAAGGAETGRMPSTIVRSFVPSRMRVIGS